MTRPLFAVAAVALAACSLAAAVPEGWLGSLDDGIRAAQRSGKPVLLVTTWAGKA